MGQRETVFDLSDFERDVLLIDGSTIHLRPIKPSDADALQKFFERLSRRSRYLRFHHLRPHVNDEETRHLTDVEYRKASLLV
jgi:hypothetical protein